MKKSIAAIIAAVAVFGWALVPIRKAVSQEPQPTRYYDARDVPVAGENPWGNVVELTAGSLKLGSVVHVFGAVQQEGSVDYTLQVEVLMTDTEGNLTRPVWGPVPLNTATAFSTDIVFYQGTAGPAYKLSGIGSLSSYPAPVEQAAIIGSGGPINLTRPVLLAFRVLGNVTPQSEVVSRHLVAKVL
jgi:ribosomal protein S28E/S33